MQRATLRVFTFSVSQGLSKTAKKAKNVAWFILAIVIWASLMYLVGPLLKKQSESPLFETDIAAYKAEIDRLDQAIAIESTPDLETQKVTLQRQLLDLTKKRGRAAPASMKWVINLLFAGFIAGGAGLYALLGSPNIESEIEMANVPDIAAPETASVDDMLRMLKQRLDTDRQSDPQGWLIYARTLMTENRFDEAFSAYERLLSLTNNDERVAKELAGARSFAENLDARPPGPSQDDMDAAAQMTPEARAAMINNMVEGLAERLAESPEDAQGWIRLLNARTVLGQNEAFQADIATVKTVYANQPEILKEILSSAGVNETEP